MENRFTLRKVLQMWYSDKKLKYRGTIYGHSEEPEIKTGADWIELLDQMGCDIDAPMIENPSMSHPTESGFWTQHGGHWICYYNHIDKSKEIVFLEVDYGELS